MFLISGQLVYKNTKLLKLILTDTRTVHYRLKIDMKTRTPPERASKKLSCEMQLEMELEIGYQEKKNKKKKSTFLVFGLWMIFSTTFWGL